MPKKNKSIPHPDDFMVVRIALEMRAKPNPDFDDPSDLGIIAHERVLAASRAEDYVVQVLNAIRDRRLYGLMAQSGAQSSVGSREWIGVEVDDLEAEIRMRSSGSGPSLDPSDEDEPT